MNLVFVFEKQAEEFHLTAIKKVCLFLQSVINFKTIVGNLLFYILMFAVRSVGRMFGHLEITFLYDKSDKNGFVY